MTIYIKRKSDGSILHSCSTQTVSNPEHLVSCQNVVTSRGMNLSDFVIADGTDAEILVMIKDAVTPLEKWMNDMRNTDEGMSRTMEDMLDGMPDKSGVAQITLDKLQAKKDLRATKP